MPLGGFFCNDTTTYFRDLSNVNGTPGLARFSVERNVLQAYSAPTCTGEAFGRPARAAAARPARR